MTSRRVLVVDDEPYILRSLSYVLRREGLEVHEARTGREALEKVRAHRPGLVFLDAMMPEVSGFEVCQEIKADPSLAGTRVVILTARGQDQDRGRAAGADLYLTKPFSPVRIVEIARDLLEEKGSPSPGPAPRGPSA